MKTLALALGVALCAISPLVAQQQEQSSLSPAIHTQPIRPVFDRAIVTEQNVSRAKESEAGFLQRSQSAAPAGHQWFEVIEASSPSPRVVVLAPHATAHMREGKAEWADSGTGSLAEMLHELTGVPVVATTYLSPSDPNYYDDNDFKKAVADLVRRLKPALVLDLHASHWYRPYDVDLGTMHGTSLRGHLGLIQQLGKRLKAEGMLNISQDYFAAEKNQTDTKWVSNLGFPAIQCEINLSWLLSGESDPDKQGVNWGERLNEHRFAQLLQGFVRFIRRVDIGQETSSRKQ